MIAKLIDLYAAGTSNGMRARMALEECGLAYAFHPVALDKGENKTPRFLALNPNAQIPVIVDRDGPGGQALTLSQSSAILIYCAEKSGKYLPKEGAARAAMWQALMSASTDITPTLGSVFAVVRSKEPTRLRRRRPISAKACRTSSAGAGKWARARRCSAR